MTASFGEIKMMSLTLLLVPRLVMSGIVTLFYQENHFFTTSQNLDHFFINVQFIHL